MNFFERYKDLLISQSPPPKQYQIYQSPPRLPSATGSVARLQSSSSPTRGETLHKYKDCYSNGYEPIIVYNPPDRSLVQALLCEFSVQKLNNIPYSGSVRVQRKNEEREAEEVKMRTERERFTIF